VKCPTCAGSGWYFEKRGSGTGGWVHTRIECPCGEAERDRWKAWLADKDRWEREVGAKYEREGTV